MRTPQSDARLLYLVLHCMNQSACCGRLVKPIAVCSAPTHLYCLYVYALLGCVEHGNGRAESGQPNSQDALVHCDLQQAVMPVMVILQ
jgi:hypothetical protein